MEYSTVVGNCESQLFDKAIYVDVSKWCSSEESTAQSPPVLHMAVGLNQLLLDQGDWAVQACSFLFLCI